MRKNKVKKTKFNKFFALIFCLISFFAVLASADLFSSLITVGGFSFANDNITVPKYTVYSICASTSTTQILASDSASAIQEQGGAGFILLNENQYCILTSIYENKADAENVLKKIIESKPNSFIITISIPQININTTLSTQEKEILYECLNIFKSTYKELYDISVSLDTSVINEVNAKLDINDIGSKINKSLGKFNTIFTNNITTNLMVIKLALQNLNNQIASLIETTEIKPYTSLIKYNYCKTIMIYKNLAEELNY